MKESKQKALLRNSDDLIAAVEQLRLSALLSE